ncbi:helix-turn-helix domain-containing protein [Chromobacterium paludis]|uniref:Helix-turn-helix transcriptional regulator n=1 Tax=Chromobacterium paludis TaxID=2605945 RepID=A0A5C1DFD7_9NEIS|nr:helix-turn-helix transcriptional regulator [Chromobacterium paludis]QEL55480.1 helix-turn-helix transcriptional regulator [Chromobacterium paludis]
MLSLAERIRHMRLERRWTQAELARKASVSPSTIKSLENGYNRSTTRLANLARALRVTPEWLQTGRGPRDPLSPSEAAYIAADSLDDLADKLLDRGAGEIGKLMTLLIKKQAERNG